MRVHCMPPLSLLSLPMLLVLLCCSAPALAAADSSVPAPTPEEAAKHKQVLIAKATKDLQRNVEQAAGVLAETFKDDLAAWTTLRPTAEGAGSAESCAAVQQALLQIYLKRGMLLFPFEDDHPVRVAYKDGKLPMGLYLGEEDGNYLIAKHVRYLVVPRMELKPGHHAVLTDVYDLQRGGKVLSFGIALPQSPDYADQDIMQWQVLPDRNRKILGFAIAHLSLQVDRGECWDLPAHVINGDGGHVTSYTFGTEVPWAESMPGDVITFGTDGASGGHVMVLLRWNKDRSQALILHQNANGVRAVAMATLGPVELGKAGQKLAIWRP